MSRDLSVHEMEVVANYFKEDLQRDANRSIRRKDPQRALVSLEGMEIVDRLLFQLKLAAGSSMGQPKAEPRKTKKGELHPFERRESA